jgi:hypothetical protein
MTRRMSALQLMSKMMRNLPPQIAHNSGETLRMWAARANPSHDQPALVDFGAAEFSFQPPGGWGRLSMSECIWTMAASIICTTADHEFSFRNVLQLTALVVQAQCCDAPAGGWAA